MSYSPLDISYINTYLPKFDAYISQIDGINFEKSLIDLNLINNEVNLRLDRVYLKNYKSNISNVNINQAIVSFSASDLIKKKIKLKKISISEGSLDIYEIKDSNFLDNINQPNDFLQKHIFENVKLNNININVYSKNKKKVVISNLNSEIYKKNRNFLFNYFNINSITYKNHRNNDDINITDIKLEKVDGESYFIDIKNIIIKSEFELTKNKYIRNINNIALEDIYLNFNKKDKTVIAQGNFFDDKLNNTFSLTGNISKYGLIKGQINIDLKNYPLLSIIEVEAIKEKKYDFLNASSIFFNGKCEINIKDNFIRDANLKIASSNSKNNFTLINLQNQSSFDLEDIALDLYYKNSNLEIRKLYVNKKKEKILINGYVNRNKNTIDASVNFEKFEYDKFLKLSNNHTKIKDKFANYIREVNADNIKNFQLNISNIENRVVLNNFSFQLDNIKFKTGKSIKFETALFKIVKDKNSIKINSPKIKVISSLGVSYLSELNIISSNFNDIFDNYEISTNIKTNYKFFQDFLLEILPKQDLIDNIVGNIDGHLKLKKLPEVDNLLYEFIGDLNDFSYKSINNQELPLRFEKFFGKIELTEKALNIKANGLINNSNSKIKILVDENSLMKMNIVSDAKFSSFDFLGNYNFLENGNVKLKMIVTKYLKSPSWTADINANLFSNKINIDYINYVKPENKRGKLSGMFYFNNSNLIKIEKMNFFTEDLLINSDLSFEKNTNLRSIKVNRLIFGKSDFQAKIDIISKDKSEINIEGESIDIKQFLESESNKDKDIKFSLNISNLYYDEVKYGNTSIISEIKNSKLHTLNGYITHNNTKYVRFSKSNVNSNGNNILQIYIDDFGSFLNNINISDTFLKGKAEVNLEFNNFNLLSGKLHIDESSIKNSSFLARLLQLASFTGLLEILTNEGIPFDTIDLEFFKKGNNINIKEAKFQGFSLGGKFSGSAELKTREIDFEGVIVPAYAINSLLNKIPLIGQVITGIEGDGLIGVNFKAQGTYDNPDYIINPLSILTPGIIRSIFDSFFEGGNNEVVTE